MAHILLSPRMRRHLLQWEGHLDEAPAAQGRGHGESSFLVRQFKAIVFVLGKDMAMKLFQRMTIIGVVHRCCLEPVSAPALFAVDVDRDAVLNFVPVGSELSIRGDSPVVAGRTHPVRVQDCEFDAPVERLQQVAAADGARIVTLASATAIDLKVIGDGSQPLDLCGLDVILDQPAP